MKTRSHVLGKYFVVCLSLKDKNRVYENCDVIYIYYIINIHTHTSERKGKKQCYPKVKFLIYLRQHAKFNLYYSHIHVGFK